MIEMTTSNLMRRCAKLAKQAQRNGDAPVGSVVVFEQRIIGEGLEAVKARLDVTSHAELNAIRAACEARRSLDLRGCVLYTTAEPCWMCSYAIRRTGIGEVVIGSSVPWVGGVTSPHPILTEDGIGCWSAPPKVAFYKPEG